MASKKASSRVRKAAKPAARPSPRKAAAHRSEARKAPAVSQRTSERRAAARPAARPASRPAEKAVATRQPAARPAAAAARATPAPATPPAAAKAAPSTSRGPAASGRGGPLPVITTVRTGVRPLGEADEVEGADPGSLLAGPRNVKPYVARRGEQYMGKQQLAHFHQILTSWKHDLMMEVDRTVTHMKDEAANFPDPNDRATQEEEFSLELRTRDRERKLIRKIDEALKRVEDGSYGYCLETGEEIGIKRLEARPVATLSLEAQERRERRERQYGDRDDRYR
ncbi:MAG: RNA polymerase-binding protein DksA [Gammaproteobacteria bacterium]|nr:RNA polymerase-binding protein DksA [Gammaproteobacteria bacterium]